MSLILSINGVYTFMKTFNNYVSLPSDIISTAILVMERVNRLQNIFLFPEEQA